MNPINLLPVDIPYKDTKEYPKDYFYNNVIQYLIPDVVRMEMNGIPIDMEQVKKLEETVDSILAKANTKVHELAIMLDFLASSKATKDSKAMLEKVSKQRDASYYYKEFNFKNTEHRTYVINKFLEDKPHLQQEKWSIKDIKILNSMLDTSFISHLLNGEERLHNDLIKNWMEELAEKKAYIYNKSMLTKAKDKLDSNTIQFNLGSTKQKADFFTYLGIESESLTDKGQPKWDRDELEKLQKQLTTLLEE